MSLSQHKSQPPSVGLGGVTGPGGEPGNKGVYTVTSIAQDEQKRNHPLPTTAEGPVGPELANIALSRLLDQALDRETFHRQQLMAARRIRTALEDLMPPEPIDEKLPELWAREGVNRG